MGKDLHYLPQLMEKLIVREIPRERQREIRKLKAIQKAKRFLLLMG